MELSDIYIPPTPAEERDEARAEVERLRALLREVARSDAIGGPTVRHDMEIQVDQVLWERLRKEFGQ